MLTDIEIAQQAKLLPIKEIAAQLAIEEDELEKVAVEDGFLEFFKKVLEK